MRKFEEIQAELRRIVAANIVCESETDDIILRLQLLLSPEGVLVKDHAGISWRVVKHDTDVRPQLQGFDAFAYVSETVFEQHFTPFPE